MLVTANNDHLAECEWHILPIIRCRTECK